MVVKLGVRPKKKTYRIRMSENKLQRKILSAKRVYQENGGKSNI
jgi:hypothetical protein